MTINTPILRGSNAERSRSSNRRAVLGRIHQNGKMGRAELARALGLSTQAISNIIAELQDDGMLIEAGTRSKGRGLPAVLYGLNPDGGYAMGVEIRPDAVITSLLNLNGDAVGQARFQLVNTLPNTVIHLIQRARQDMCEAAQVSLNQLLGAGIVMPGPFGKTGLSGTGSDLTGWQEIDALTLFSEALDMPIELSNDANAAAISERIGGVGQNLSHFAYLYFGAGLGLGLISQNQVVAGAFGNAGEIGHIPIATATGPVSLENRLSRVAVATYLDQQEVVDFSRLETLFSDNDPTLFAWLDDASDALAQATAMIENFFDPQTIILGGAMPETIVDQLIKQTLLPSLSVANRPDSTLPRLQRGTCGRMTATMGAASLILNSAFSPQSATT